MYCDTVSAEKLTVNTVLATTHQSHHQHGKILEHALLVQQEPTLLTDHVLVHHEFGFCFYLHDFDGF